MTRDQKARQKSLERKAAKQKQRRVQTSRAIDHVSSQVGLRSAAAWPLYECLITQDWRNVETLVQILVARQSPSGSLVAGVFLVDLGCLGVKNAFARQFRSFADYESLRQGLMSTQPFAQVDLNTAAKIVREAIAYSRKLGFEPDPDYWTASLILAGADPDASDEQIPLGRDGKPFFVAGPHDNPRKIVAKLTRAVGPGNFDYVVPLGPPPGDW